MTSLFRFRPTVSTFTWALIAALASPISLVAQAPVEQLHPYVTTATRTPASVRTLGTVTNRINGDELARYQLNSFAEAMSLATGTPVLRSGAPGSSAAIFLRGANSNQTLFLVDGLRMNDPNTDYAVMLGGACAAACDSLEVSHGPQSTLYGGEAVGGVVSLRSQRGQGEPSGHAGLEVGSFSTVQGALSAQGEKGETAYNFAAQGGHTDNDRPHNAFDSMNTTLRIDHDVSAQISLGATVRYFHGEYESPGDRFTNDPDNVENEDNLIATFFADFKNGDDWHTHVTLGGQDRRFVSDTPSAFGPSVVVVKNRRAVLDWQTTFSGIERHRLTGGFTGEINHTSNSGYGAINEHQQLLAFFLQDEINPVENVYLTLGLRRDDFDTFGQTTTGRATAAWLVANQRAKLRASYGTGFRSPSFLDLYGTSAFYQGNPNLRPEESRGWDAGVDYYLASQRGSLSATWFENRFSDLIVYDFNMFPGTTANVEKARTRGVELKGDFRLGQTTHAQLAYTYLEAENQTQNIRLLRRARHSATMNLWHDFGGGFSAGAGASWVAGREDVNAQTFATIDGEDYLVARLYGAWEATDRLTLTARIENLFDESYEQVHGYPQPGTSVYGGVRWEF